MPHLGIAAPGGLLAVTWLWLCLASASHASGTLELGQAERYNLGPHLEMLDDPDGLLTIETVRGQAHTLPFRKVRVAVPNLGFTTGAYWLRFRVQNPERHWQGRQWLLELDYPFADEAELYGIQPDGQLSRQLLGDRLPYGERTWRHRTLVFDLDKIDDTPRTFYLRVQSSAALSLPLNLVTTTAFSAHVATENLVFGLYFGILLAMLIYNLFIYASVRDQSYLRYCQYVLVFLVLQVAITGHGFQYLWGPFPNLANLLPPVLVCLSCLTAIRFAIAYMEVSDRRPQLMPWLNGLTWTSGIGGFVALIAPVSLSAPLSVLIASLTALGLLHAAIDVMRHGSRPAQFFLAAWLMLLTGALLKALSVAGLLPINTLTLYLWQAGSCLEVLLLSLGLADRINILRREHLSAIQQVFEMEKIAHTDRLTGLYNRTYFEREFQQHVGYALKNSHSHFALFVIDLIGLKQINDLYGHSVGDQAIRMTARILRNQCRQSDLVTRIGGDEFAIICTRMTQEDYHAFVERIEKKATEGRIKFQKGEEIIEIAIHLSIGHAHTAEVPPGHIFEHADKDMYAKKNEFYRTNERYRPLGGDPAMEGSPQT